MTERYVLHDRWWELTRRGRTLAVAFATGNRPVTRSELICQDEDEARRMARVLCDIRLVRGYALVEEPKRPARSVPAAWSELAAGPVSRERLRAHFAPLGAGSASGRDRLERILARVEGIEVLVEANAEPRLVVRLARRRLQCSLPRRRVPRRVPPGLGPVLAIHGALWLEGESLQLGYETGFEQEGWLEGTAYDGRSDLVCPLRVGPDLYFHDPRDGRLLFIDHEADGEPRPEQAAVTDIFLEHLDEALPPPAAARRRPARR